MCVCVCVCVCGLSASCMSMFWALKKGNLLLNHAYFHLLFCPTINWAKDLVTLKIEILVIGFNRPELSKLLTCCPSLSHCVVAALIASLSFSGLGSAVNSRRRQCSTPRSPSPMPSQLWTLPFPRGSNDNDISLTFPHLVGVFLPSQQSLLSVSSS